MLVALSWPQAVVKPPMAVTNAVSWRSEGIRHKKNEVGAGACVPGRLTACKLGTRQQRQAMWVAPSNWG